MLNSESKEQLCTQLDTRHRVEAARSDLGWTVTLDQDDVPTTLPIRRRVFELTKANKRRPVSIRMFLSSRCLTSKQMLLRHCPTADSGGERQPRFLCCDCLRCCARPWCFPRRCTSYGLRQLHSAVVRRRRLVVCESAGIHRAGISVRDCASASSRTNHGPCGHTIRDVAGSVTVTQCR